MQTWVRGLSYTNSLYFWQQSVKLKPRFNLKIYLNFLCTLYLGDFSCWFLSHCLNELRQLIMPSVASVFDSGLFLTPFLCKELPETAIWNLVFLRPRKFCHDTHFRPMTFRNFTLWLLSRKQRRSIFFHNLKTRSLCFSSVGLLNLRGFDIKYTPVFFSYAIVTENSVT